MPKVSVKHNACAAPTRSNKRSARARQNDFLPPPAHMTSHLSHHIPSFVLHTPTRGCVRRWQAMQKHRAFDNPFAITVSFAGSWRTRNKKSFYHLLCSQSGAPRLVAAWRGLLSRTGRTIRWGGGCRPPACATHAAAVPAANSPTFVAVSCSDCPERRPHHFAPARFSTKKKVLARPLGAARTATTAGTSCGTAAIVYSLLRLPRVPRRRWRVCLRKVHVGVWLCRHPR